jgi:hypothetical protein
MQYPWSPNHPGEEPPPLSLVFWHEITRLGEAQVLLPAAVVALAWLVLRAGRAAPGSGVDAGARATAWRWGLGLVAGTALTTASKIAFIGFGIGWAALDFTGFSGHSMYSAAVLPVLAVLVAGRRGMPVGFVLAWLVMVSRIHVHAHSWSEAVSGNVIGTAIAVTALWGFMEVRPAPRAPRWLPGMLAAWLVVLPFAPPSRAHDGVVALSLWLSGRPAPYTREQMLWEARHRPVAAPGAGPVSPASRETGSESHPSPA